MTAPRGNGRIITFYSYKGGTGRSMALANVAWILASNGLRVLAIDWDLEAPGLHRYFHPFLEDPELENSPGLIDYVSEFAEAARHAERDKDASSSPQKWYDRYTSLMRFTYPLDWDFGRGTLDLVPAGQQGHGYALRVHGFDWQEFYDKLGGGVLLEAVKNRLREDYDYVLIDSRTGISDTAGICTVQMPDALAVCFTLNRQSVRGAVAVAASAHRQRLRPDRTPGLTVWPVPMRIELGEKDRLDAARELYRTECLQFIAHLKRVERDRYWSDVEVLYHPYFAYEETLATFAERRGRKGSLLSSFEALTSRLTGGTVPGMASMREDLRLKALGRFAGSARTADSGPPSVYLSSTTAQRVIVNKIEKALKARGIECHSLERLAPGSDRARAMAAAIDQSAALVVVAGRKLSETQEAEVAQARAAGKPILPVFPSKASRPAALRSLVGIETKGDLMSKTDLGRLIDALPIDTRPLDPDDPQKGVWGGNPSRNDRALSAVVKGIGDDWYGISLSVASTDSRRPLSGVVEFHLHPTFSPNVLSANVEGGKAILYLEAYGAFTVGAKADAGATRLELDLAALSTAPKAFRER